MATVKRSEERVLTTRPVRLDRGTGIARDVSASRVYFETDVDYADGSNISFAIGLDGPAGKMICFDVGARSCGSSLETAKWAWP